MDAPNATNAPNEPLLAERRDERGVVTLTLNSPSNLNALSEAMLAALQAAFDRLAKDESVRVVVLGAVGKAFSGGHNLKEMIRFGILPIVAIGAFLTIV